MNLKPLLAFIPKKPIIRWIAAILIPIAAVAIAMSPSDFKDAICSAEVKDKAPAPPAEPAPVAEEK